MTQNQQLIDLIYNAARADLQRILAEPEPPPHRRWERADWQFHRENAEHNIVPLNSRAWLGVDGLESASAMAMSRAFRAGEQAGRWVRIIESGKTVALLLLEGVSDDA